MKGQIEILNSRLNKSQKIYLQQYFKILIKKIELIYRCKINKCSLMKLIIINLKEIIKRTIKMKIMMNKKVKGKDKIH
jgi:hypothetical protein